MHLLYRALLYFFVRFNDNHFHSVEHRPEASANLLCIQESNGRVLQGSIPNDDQNDSASNNYEAVRGIENVVICKQVGGGLNASED